MLLLLFWCFYGAIEVASHDALHINYALNYVINFEEIIWSSSTACPASTPKEKEFNYNVSISEKSMFMKDFYHTGPEIRKMQLNICESAFTPGIIYDKKNKIYEIGYELYYEETQTKFIQDPTSFKHDDHVSVHFPSLVPFEKPSCCDYVKKYEDDEQVKFKFVDGSETLGFNWVPLLYMSVTTKSRSKQITFSYWDAIVDEEYDPENKFCDGYHHLKYENIQYLFSEENQEKFLKNLLIPPLLSTQNPDISFPQHYGYLVKSFLIPVWYSKKHAFKRTFCTWMNFMPVWKTIAQGQLRKVEAFVFLLVSKMRLHRLRKLEGVKMEITELSSGICDVLKLTNKNNSQSAQEIYLSDKENYYTIPVPRIIFKIIRLEMLEERGVVIVIHNNPILVPDSDRICTKEFEVPGWSGIRNDDPRTGLTYACPLTPEVMQKLQINNFITFNHSDFAFDFEGCFPREARNVKQSTEKLMRWLEKLDDN